jgi:intracellular sulfur oxidation DsrE/DsrF family protein
VEVVINGEGLNLVRTDVTAFADRIARMQKQYGNLVFAACQNTMERLKREQGIDARLLPGVTVIDSGVAQLMRRQQQGWAYIRV